MSEVDVKIGGHGYRLMCRDGDEPALLAAAAYLNEKAEGLMQGLGAMSEGRLLLMSALVVVGELLTLRREMSHAPTAVAADAADADTLEAMIARVEALAQQLEKAAALENISSST